MRRNAVRELLKVTAQPGIISFAGGLPAAELFPMARVREALDRVCSTYGPASLQYSETEGVGALRDYLAARFSTKARPVTRENVLITTGAQQALDLIGRIFLEQGNGVIVENPTYLALLSCWRPLGIEYLPIPSDAGGMDVSTLASCVKRQPKLIYTVPNFQNPQGSTLSLERRRQLLEWSSQHGVPVIEDDPYGELRYDGQPLPGIWQLSERVGAPGHSSVIHVGTFSKVLMPGLRLGWVMAPENVISKLVLAKQSADLHSSTLNQYLALELLNANYLDEILPVLRRSYRERRDAMLAALARFFPKGVRWTKPEGGMFLLVTFPAHENTSEMLPRALEQQVAYVPGAEFHADGTGENTLRLNFSNSTPEKIELGIQRLAAVFGAQAVFDTPSAQHILRA
jgi:2-aminoadipate transaminase